MKNSQRLQILTEQDVWAIYGRPNFSTVERQHYFSLTEVELRLLKLNAINKKSVSSTLYFILQFGYFKAKYLFFQFNYTEVLDDVTFILDVYMPNYSIPLKLPSKPVQLNTRRNILDLLKFQDDSDEMNELIFKKSHILVQKIVNPPEIFSELKDTLEQNHFVLPPYYRLQDIIGTALKNEETRIIKILQNNLTSAIEQSLNSLLKIENIFYKITELQFDAKTFRTQEMQLELSKLEACQTIYLFSQKIIPMLMISRKNITNNSDLARIYTVFRLKR